MAKVKIQANEIASGNGTPIEAQDVVVYKYSYPLADLPGNAHITKDHLGALASPAVPIMLDTTQPSLYTLTADEVSAVNELSRQPNFSAVTDSGQSWGDIYPIYTPAFGVGAYSDIKIVLHDNGSGLNSENTLVQFS